MLKTNLNSSKSYKVFLFGFKSTGKTTILEKLIFGNRSNHQVFALELIHLNWSIWTGRLIRILLFFWGLKQKNNETIDDIYIGTLIRSRSLNCFQLRKQATVASKSLFNALSSPNHQPMWTTNAAAKRKSGSMIPAESTTPTSTTRKRSKTTFTVRTPSCSSIRCPISHRSPFWTVSKSWSIESRKRKRWVVAGDR